MEMLSNYHGHHRVTPGNKIFATRLPWLVTMTLPPFFTIRNSSSAAETAFSIPFPTMVMILAQ
jgi:hypothetical protein